MLAVRLPEAELVPLLTAPLGLAAVNGPALSVVAGPDEAVALLEQTLSTRGVSCRRLHTSHAFHSPMMDAAVAPLAERFRHVRLSPPRSRYVSTVTGTWITVAEATSPEYWSRHCRESVRFADALATIAADGSIALLEVGPGTALETFAHQGKATGTGFTITGSLPGATRDTDDVDSMLASLGRLWAAGVEPDWEALHGNDTRRRVALPTYPFERARHWIDAPRISAGRETRRPEPSPLLNQLPNVISIADISAMHTQTPMPENEVSRAASRVDGLRQIIRVLLEELSGEVLADADPEASFLELGFDSLLLGQFAQRLQARVGLTVGFRELLGDLPSITALARHAAATLPSEQEREAPASAPAALPHAASVLGTIVAPTGAASSVVEGVMREQLQAMQQLIQQQLQVLQGLAPATAAPTTPALPATPPAASTFAMADSQQPSRLQVYRAGAGTEKGDMTDVQRAHVDALIASTIARTGG